MATKRSKKATRAELELKSLNPKKAPADLRQIQAVLSKVQIAIADYLKSGAPLKITLNPVEILSAIEAAIREAEGHPSPWPGRPHLLHPRPLRRPHSAAQQHLRDQTLPRRHRALPPHQPRHLESLPRKTPHPDRRGGIETREARGKQAQSLIRN